MSQSDISMPVVDESRKGAKVQSNQTLAQAFLVSRRTYGGGHVAARDALSGELTADGLATRALLLARGLRKLGADRDARIGLMLPTAAMTMACLLAVQFMGRVTTMINFNAGAKAVLSACATAQLKTILTSRAFIERANLGLLADAIAQAGTQVVYIEDLQAQMTVRDKAAVLTPVFRARALRRVAERGQADDPAIVLFTSGSEGDPKGVVLSHRNILSNIAQFTARLDIGAWDGMFCCLPLYHSFGLTVGALLPLLSGMATTFYPSPLHYHEVPKAIRESRATLMLTTDTFLTGYARTGTRQDFETLRYIVPGAEGVKAETRRIWTEQFGKVLFEGYGVTETAPVISVNAPDAYRSGTAGRILPGLDAQVRPVEGITEGGELCVRGPNVMLGYMFADAPGILVAPEGGWHKTGDIAVLDEDGFLAIKGRIRRFAKIGGEMISLGAVEQAVARVCPGVLHAAVSVPHARRGESVVLLTEEEKIDADALRQGLRAQGLIELALPRQILSVDKIPVLGSGKIDYITARRVAMGEVETASPIMEKSA